MSDPFPTSPKYVRSAAKVALPSALAGIVALVLTVGYGLADGIAGSLGVVALLVAPLLLTGALFHYRAAAISISVDASLLASALGLWLFDVLGAAAVALCAWLLVVALRVVRATDEGKEALDRLPGQPTRLLLVSIIGTILLGALFLTFPAATIDGQGTTAIDAIFMSTSATCVTGLSVVNLVADGLHNPVLTTLTPFGQLVLLVLVQIGGLGIMTLSAAVVIVLGGRIGPRTHQALQSSVEEEHRRHLERSLRKIFQMTVIIECIGAALLFVRFYPTMSDVGLAAWHSVFLAVSAFNNAGFALFSDNLTSYRSDLLVNLVVMGLITAGGLGFLVIATLTRWKSYRQSVESTWHRFPPQVRVVVTFSTLLTLAGTVLFYYFDFARSLDGLSRGDKLLAAAFQSVTFRTAGFNTVDLSEISRVTLVISLILMYVGGSPGGTAGGVKTTTVAVAAFAVIAMLRGRDEVEIGDRSVPKAVVYRSIAILLSFTGVFVVGVILMLVAEPDKSLDSLLFETMSALGTVGVSFGITPYCSAVGKLVLVMLMFAGRVGPLSMALAIGEDVRGRAGVKLPEGKMMVG
ncbi:MAG: Trk family potassium uptake protein [Myxococcales bacterium]|nr:Trk family potassium uptake protein [Myxococcales bacterium]